MKKYRPSIFDALIRNEQRRIKIMTLIWYVLMFLFVLTLFLGYLLVTN